MADMLASLPAYLLRNAKQYSQQVAMRDLV